MFFVKLSKIFQTIWFFNQIVWKLFLQLMVRCPGLEKKPSMIIVGDMGRKTNVSFGSIH